MYRDVVDIIEQARRPLSCSVCCLACDVWQPPTCSFVKDEGVVQDGTRSCPRKREDGHESHEHVFSGKGREHARTSSGPGSNWAFGCLLELYSASRALAHIIPPPKHRPSQLLRSFSQTPVFWGSPAPHPLHARVGLPISLGAVFSSWEDATLIAMASNLEAMGPGRRTL